jgi:PEP-CTERM motif
MKRILTWLMLTMPALGLVAETPGQARGDSIALNIGGVGPDAWGYAMVGWEFTTSVPITVTQLGVFDSELSSSQDQQVGVWNVTGSIPLVQATVSSTDPQTNGFTYAAVSPLSLAPGSYVIASTDNGFAYFTSGPATLFSTAPGITFVESLADTNFSLGFHKPTDVLTSYPDRLGPNFQFIAASVPEPSSLVMALIGFGLAGGFVRLRFRCS